MKLKLNYRFSAVKADWRELYGDTPEVSPFLAPEAMAIAVRYFYPYYLAWRCVPLFCRFIDDDGSVVAACALLRFRGGRVQLFGAPNGFNESGMVYRDASRLGECLNLLKSRFRSVEMLKIDSRSPLAQFAPSHSTATNNVAISFGRSFEEHFKTLSSSVRQNVRTAYNRLAKDGYAIDLQCHMGGGNTLPLSNIIGLYCSRHTQRYGVATSPLKKWFLTHQNFATRYYRFSSNALTFYLTINGAPAAFMSGLWHGDRLIVPRLSINAEFRRYSPGLILICETIKYLIANTSVSILDLSQGEEPYKYQLGGEMHQSYRWFL